MTHYAVNGAVLLLGLLLAPSAGAQNFANPAAQGIEDVVVRPVSEVGTLERVTIALTRAFIPGSKTFAPLYAYRPELACADSGDTNETVINHPGPAALVYDDKGVSRARYHKTTELAIRDAVSSGLCKDDSDRTWFFATTSPLDSDDIEELQRYISRDVEQVDRQLDARPD